MAELFTDTSVAAWRKSRFCNGASACVEVASLADGNVALRDSKEPDGPALVFTPSEWAAFIAGARDGEFDLAELKSAALAPDGTGRARASEPPVAASGADSVPR